MKLLSLLFVLSVSRGAPLVEPPPAPPRDVTVEKWLMTWTPAAEETNVFYTVQFRSFDDGAWRNMPACVRMASTQCNVSATVAEAAEGCVQLRVRAERSGLRSQHIEACSQYGDSCSPEVRLSAQPSSLTIHLSRNHSLVQTYADHAKYIVYYGLEGAPLEDAHRGTLSSVSLPDLQNGRRYCVRVQFTIYNKTYGPPSCTYCLLIPHAKPNLTRIVVTVVVVLIAVVVILLIVVFIFMFRHKTIKQWLGYNRYAISIEPFLVEHRPIPTSDPSEEEYDVISSITPAVVPPPAF